MSPIQLGSMTVKNRIAMAPMGTITRVSRVPDIKGIPETIHDIDTVILAVGSMPEVDAENLLLKKKVSFGKLAIAQKRRK